MRPGSIVEVRLRDDAPAVPAIVLHDWETPEDGSEPSVSLYAFQFETQAFMRAVPKELVKVLIDAGDSSSLLCRVLEDVDRIAISLGRRVGDIDDNIVRLAQITSKLEDRLAAVETVLADLTGAKETAKPEPERATGESRRERRVRLAGVDLGAVDD